VKYRHGSQKLHQDKNLCSETLRHFLKQNHRSERFLNGLNKTVLLVKKKLWDFSSQDIPWIITEI